MKGPMKIILHYQTPMGASSVVTEVADKDRALAIVQAHRAFGGLASLLEDAPRYDMKKHMARHKMRRATVDKITILKAVKKSSAD